MDNITLIIILIDGKLHTSFNGDLNQWLHKRFFKVINPKPQTSITELNCSVDIIRSKSLRIFGNVHAVRDMTLALFCYDMVNPTKKRIKADMSNYEIEQYQYKCRR